MSVIEKELSVMTEKREQFSSRLGFVIAAAGCAVGVGNIWSFPTQTAQNGGAAFVLAYLLFSFLLAYPTLVAELTIGRYRRQNSVAALSGLGTKPWLKHGGTLVALMGLATLTLIYSFYSIVGGWFVNFSVGSVAAVSGGGEVANWLQGFSTASTVMGTLVFMVLTTLIVTGGVQDGIERWCNRLMPTLIVLLVILVLFAVSRPGGMTGLGVYLLPDFSKLLNQKLLISALGQSFFSMSLGVGCMMIYGSYLSKKSNLPLTAFQVTLVDSSVAFLAGLLIIPCMYAAIELGVNVYSPEGTLLSSDTLVFTVLPALFGQLGVLGQLVSIAFFALLVIASLTSSISLVEPTVAWLVERWRFRRTRASWFVTLVAAGLSLAIIQNVDQLLGLAVKVTTQYLQPVLCLVMALFGGWVMWQDRLLKELRQGFADIDQSLFWKWWPWYVRFVCPVLILLLFLSNL